MSELNFSWKFRDYWCMKIGLTRIMTMIGEQK